MRTYYSTENRGTLHNVIKFRCELCGFWVKYDRPSGGEYVPDPTATSKNTADGGTGATNNYQGCPFCMSPAHNNKNAKLGDLRRLFPSRTKGNRKRQRVLVLNRKNAIR